MQNIALRNITGSPWYVKNNVIHSSPDLKSIQESIIIASHNIFYKTSTSYRAHLQALSLQLATVDWKKTRPTRLLNRLSESTKSVTPQTPSYGPRPKTCINEWILQKKIHSSNHVTATAERFIICLTLKMKLSFFNFLNYFCERVRKVNKF